MYTIMATIDDSSQLPIVTHTHVCSMHCPGTVCTHGRSSTKQILSEIGLINAGRVSGGEGALAVLALDLRLDVGGLPPGGLDDLAVLATEELALDRALLGHVGLYVCACVRACVYVYVYVGGRAGVCAIISRV